MDAKDAKDPKSGEKRRLGMLPEVLPAPSNQPIQGSPRQRTVRTMERLLAAAAASALIASCSSDKGGTAAGGGGPASSGSGSGSGGNGSSGSNGGGGYGVVDPLPPPARCMGVAGSIQATAAWKEGPSGTGLVLSIELSKPGQSDASYLDLGPPVVSNATLVSSTLIAGALVVEIQPMVGSYAQVSVGVTCSAGDGHVAIYPEFMKPTDPPPKAGDPVKLSLEDTY